jgi:hypothetical protein
MTPLAALHSLIAQGESETLEFKRSTAELRRAGETLCAFLNGDGGQVLVGVGRKGPLVGQQIADITLREKGKLSQAALRSSQVALLSQATEPKTLVERMAVAGRPNRTRFRDEVLSPLSEADRLEKSVPDEPRSPKQRYRTTSRGPKRRRAGAPRESGLLDRKAPAEGGTSGALKSERFSALQIAMQLFLSPAHHDSVPDEEFSREDADLAIAITAALLRLAPRWGAQDTERHTKELS